MESNSNYGKVCQLLSKLRIKIKLKENIGSLLFILNILTKVLMKINIYFPVINLDNLDY